MQKIFLLLILSLFCLDGFSQDTIQLINGKKIIVKSLTIEAEGIAYKLPDKKKVKKIDGYKVFSVIYKDGTEKVVFQTDTMDPLDFKESEMRSFIKGEQDAQLLYRTYAVPAMGVGVGVASGFYAIWGVVGPAAFSTLIGAFSPNVDKSLSFKVCGDGSQAIGINDGKYLNEVTSTSFTPLKKDQYLKINGKKFKFKQEANLDSTVSIINESFNRTRVRAANDAGKLRLYKATSPELIKDEAYREGYSKKVREKNIKNGLITGFGAYVLTVITLAIISSNE